jgi:hypothetical protein
VYNYNMAALAEDYPDFPASFVLSRKGTPLLMDAHNHKYRIHSNNTDKTIATYRCIQRNAMKGKNWMFCNNY